jgi:pSer/pThr/pTyr-binding forkhead associated (FHA) protein
MIIGREAADIQLADERVSRRHALLRVTDQRVELSDVESANGTEVNGVRISSPVSLAHGDTVRVGRTTLRLGLPASMRGPAPSDGRRVEPR